MDIRPWLDPTRYPLPEAALWPTLLVGGAVCAGGVYGLTRFLRRLGPADAGRLSPLEFAAGLGLAILVPLLQVTLLQAIWSADPTERPLESGLVGLALTVAALLVLARIPAWTTNDKKLGGTWLRARPRNLLASLFVWVPALPVMQAALLTGVAACLVLGLDVSPQPQIETVTAGEGAAWVGGWYVKAAMSAPLWEEFAFRLVLFGGLAGLLGSLFAPSGWRNPGMLLAAIFSCGLFVVAHGMWPPGFLPLAVMSVLLVMLYAHTGSLWPPVLFHAAHNCFVLTMQFAALA